MKVRGKGGEEGQRTRSWEDEGDGLVAGVKRNEPIGQFTVDAESELFSDAFRRGDGGGEEAEWHTIVPF